jgi:hypothetical protein
MSHIKTKEKDEMFEEFLEIIERIKKRIDKYLNP